MDENSSLSTHLGSMAYSKQMDLVSRFGQPHASPMEHSAIISGVGVADMTYPRNDTH
jgi:hypothetical protein